MYSPSAKATGREQFKETRLKFDSQEIIVMTKLGLGYNTPSKIYDVLNPTNDVKGWKITSVRRAIDSLKNMGLVVETLEKVDSLFGGKEHVIRKATIEEQKKFDNCQISMFGK